MFKEIRAVLQWKRRRPPVYLAGLKNGIWKPQFKPQNIISGDRRRELGWWALNNNARLSTRPYPAIRERLWLGGIARG